MTAMPFQPILNALGESPRAAAIAEDHPSRSKLARDFLLSRLLKWGKLPGYNQPRCVTLDGLRVSYRFNRGDLQSLREIFLDAAYRTELPFKPRTILDLGANIGLAALWLWKHHDAAHIVTVEPDAGNAAIAELNLKQNKVEGEVLCAAVGIASGKVWFQTRAESNLGTILSSAQTLDSHAVEVPVIGISELVARFGHDGVDLIKMDIEGAEQELFGNDLSWLKRVRALLVEFHDDRVDSADLIKRVEAAGFRHSRINQDRQENLSAFVRA